MADYTKKVIYLSYMEYGNKIRSAGFIKVELCNNECSMDMHLTGIHGVEDQQYDIEAITKNDKKKAIGKIFLHKGAGTWNQSYPDNKIGLDKIDYNEIKKLYVEISDNQYIEGRLDDEKIPEQRNIVVKAELQADCIEMPEPEAEQLNTKEKIKLEDEKKEFSMDKIILNDKWQQLMQLYPIIHPYEDEREYISIHPNDFVIMTGDYQHLANNSFLLHGYYNYRHIILGKELGSDSNANTFYLGVPGLYYEREKMVALMFGFEAFECAQKEAEIGKFGYYLKKVQI